MIVIRTAEELRAFRPQLQAPVGFVPTMGDLHEGHLSLVRRAIRENSSAIASIYINPIQFEKHDDLAGYPRTWKKDKDLLANLAISAVFLPEDAVMYPEGFSTKVTAGKLASRWEGEYRPGHFDGVCTIVAKLLSLVQPDVAYFGDKDYQQLKVIQAMVRDLNIPVTVSSGDIIREPDGLALSSRNHRLPDEDRIRAPRLKAALDRVRSGLLAGGESPSILQSEREALESDGFIVDYLAAVDSESLEPVISLHESNEVRLLVAARLSSVRLIDNRAL
ncbi:pantoate--beta-alanine ligase [Candidatus Neomarinimicrobiota bacterium]